ncbi:MAG TPA: ankyrin repeat domain-containing protein [bacterium]|jgi:ankyrin repeat protein|nr:ankyrin repeat domain-containing protein [bacterium]HNZ53832.1 ankyrin repeat domain-containing protein [bacterium]HOG44075.1 ankyrin repeat domain-containing protein [bacterium]HPY14084.1 ankyrin repeat domain-containing protein [bacterium]HQM83502.1 ankyrin repeat domain-containing protein [bacterium]
MRFSKRLKGFVFLFVVFVSLSMFAETLVVMDIADKTGKIHPDVVKGSKEYVIKLLSSVGKYTVIADAAVTDARKRSKEWTACSQMDCQIEIGKAFKADVIVVPAVEYFAGIFTLTVNYIYVDGKRKVEAGATDFNGTAAGMKRALETVVSIIHGKKIEQQVLVEKNEALEKYKAENFKEAPKKEYVVPVEPMLIPIPPKILPGGVEFTSSHSGVRATVDIGSQNSASCVVPCKVKDLNPGMHTVRFELKGYTTKDESFEIRQNETAKRSVSLTPVIKSLEEINNELIQAAKEGKQKLVKELLEKGASVNYHDASGLSPLLIAALSGNRELAGYLFGRGAKFSSVEAGTLMYVAVEKNDTWIASLVARNKSDLNITFDKGRTILWHAAQKEAWDVFDQFVKSGVNLGIKDSTGSTIISWAMESGASNVIDRLNKLGVKTVPPDVDRMVKQAVTNEDIDRLSSLVMMKPNLNAVYEDGLTLLWYASIKKRTDMVATLLKGGAKANVADKTGRSLLMYCIETRRFEIAKLLKTYGAVLKNEDGVKLLQKGLVIGDSQLIQLLVQLNVNVNIKFPDGLSALWIAAFTNNREIIEVLADAGANLNIKDKNGKTVLMWSVENDRKEVANILITRGANINLMDDTKKTALMSAVIADKPRMVHMLVKNGAKIDLKDAEGNSPMLVASARGNAGLVKLFLENGAFVNGVDGNGNTPLAISLHKNFDDITMLLLDKGADINKQNNLGESPLMIVARKGQMRFVKIFVERGALIDSTDRDGNTALIHAKRENRREAVFYLLSKDAVIEKRSEQDELMAFGTLNSYHDIVTNLISRNISVNRRFTDGLFPLYYAVRNGDSQMIDILIAADADLEQRDKDGETVLLYASAKREEHVVVNLINKGANIAVTDKQKSTPLMIVAGRGFAQAVKALIDKKADVNAKDDKGRTALVRAKFTGNYNIVDMLKRAGAYE